MELMAGMVVFESRVGKLLTGCVGSWRVGWRVHERETRLKYLTGLEPSGR
jgi:hypothetical protein